jgi:4-alpha-glucanotransferase
MNQSALPTELETLASLSGIVTSFLGTDTKAHTASIDSVCAVLTALGTPVDSPRDAHGALQEARRRQAGQVIDAVITCEVGEWPTVPVNLPQGMSPDESTLTLELESGEVWRHAVADLYTGPASGRAHQGTLALQQTGWRQVEAGYHRLVIEGPRLMAQTRFIVAPPCPTPSRLWGAFMPLHAARSEGDWGIGSYSDLGALARWVEGLGAGFLGALPLYPIADRPPMDPSPYLPLSRLAYSEIHIDPSVVPELHGAPQAQQLLESRSVVRQISAKKSHSVVDYDGIVRLKRQILEALWRSLLDGGPARRDALAAFATDHPELVAYASYRASSDPGQEADYHLYVQWLAYEQLCAASRAGCPLYGDFPVGVRSDGFDAQWAPAAFASGVQGGAPPDAFFTAGQNWGFQPLHPERMRLDGYRYMIDCLQRACRHAAFLRIDHVPGLHRLFWIPDGMAATEGVYVSYRSREMRAIVCLEANRSDTVIVGEDLGTVPDVVRSDMATDHMLRSWVMQFESSSAEPLPDPPPEALASWGTHDLPRFAAFYDGLDIGPGASDETRTDRAEWRHALVQALRVEPDPDVVLRGCLRHMAAGPARLVMVDLEEFWGERSAQNHPGTGPEAMNWTRRATWTLEEMRADTARSSFLSSLGVLRQEENVQMDETGTPS